MKRNGIDFGPFFLAVNSFVILSILALGYLLFGDQLSALFAPAPEPREQPSGYANSSTTGQPDAGQVVNGIHVATGLVYAEGFDIVRGTCTACHSAKLVTQNRADREGWAQMIDWMQATQGLWDLGKNEAKILDYLAQHYAPVATGRRANLDTEAIEWYVLDLE